MYQVRGLAIPPLAKPVFVPPRPDDPLASERELLQQIEKRLEGALGTYYMHTGKSQLKVHGDLEYERQKQRVEKLTKVLGRLYTKIWTELVDRVQKRAWVRGGSLGQGPEPCSEIIRFVPRLDPPPAVIQSAMSAFSQQPQIIRGLLETLYSLPTNPHIDQRSGGGGKS